HRLRSTHPAVRFDPAAAGQRDRLSGFGRRLAAGWKRASSISISRNWETISWLAGTFSNTQLEFIANSAGPDAESIQAESQVGRQPPATFDFASLFPTIVLKNQVPVAGCQLGQTFLQAGREMFL